MLIGPRRTSGGHEDQGRAPRSGGDKRGMLLCRLLYPPEEQPRTGHARSPGTQLRRPGCSARPPGRARTRKRGPVLGGPICYRLKPLWGFVIGPRDCAPPPSHPARPAPSPPARPAPQGGRCLWAPFGWALHRPSRAPEMMAGASQEGRLSACGFEVQWSGDAGMRTLPRGKGPASIAVWQPVANLPGRGLHDRSGLAEGP